MNADERRRALNETTEAVIGCAFRVSDVLGCGFLEKVYENALAVELRRKGLKVQQQHDLRASGQRAGLLINFGRPQVEVKRVVSRF